MKLKTAYKILIIAAIALPSILLSSISMVLFRGFYSDMVKDEMSTLSYTASIRTEQYFKKYATGLQTLSGNQAVKTVASGDYASVKAEIADIFSGEKALNENILDVAIIDGSGLVVAALNDTTVQKSFFAYDEPMIATPDGSFYLSPLYIDNEKYFDTVIVFAVPIALENNSRGYICEVVSAKELTSMLSSQQLFDTGELVLIDTKGNAMNFDGKDVTRTDDMLSTPIADQISLLKTGNLTTDEKSVEFESGGTFGAYGRFSSVEWNWLGVCSSNIIMTNTFSPFMLGALVFIIFSVFNALLAFIVYRMSIGPIGKMTESIGKATEDGGERHVESGSSNYEYNVIVSVLNSLLDDASISEEIHRTVSELSDNMLFEWNLDENKMYASENFKQNFELDLSKASLLDGKFIDSLMSEADSQKFRRGLSALLKDKDYYEDEFEIQTKNNGKVWYCIKAKAVLTRLGDIIRIIGVLTDINDKKQMRLQLSQRASFDFLSQLYNRSTFLVNLQNKLDLKSANEKYAILFIDVDDFKFINDRYGHSVGDEVIKFVADTIKGRLGESGFAGRFGGDEFVVCTTKPEVTDKIDEFAMSIIDDLYSGYRCESAKVLLNIKVSVGISLFPKNGRTTDELVGAADEAMYFVKKNGKANYHVFNASDAPSLDLSNTMI